MNAADWQRVAFQVTWLAIAWTAALLAIAWWWAGEEFTGALGRIDLVLLSATLMAFAGNHGLRFIRWHLMLAAEGHRVAPLRSLCVFLAGLALVPTPGKAGVAVRSLLLLRDKVPVNVSLAAYFSERLFDLLGLLALAALALGHNTLERWSIALCAAVVLVVAVRTGPWWLGNLTSRLRHPRLVPMGRWAQEFVEHGAHLFRGRFFLPYLLLGLLANLCTAAILWFAVERLGGRVGAEQAMGVLGVSHLSGSLSLLPGGLGGFDLAMLAQLHALAIAPGIALTALGLVRIVTVWAGVIVGLPLLIALLRRRN